MGSFELFLVILCSASLALLIYVYAVYPAILFLVSASRLAQGISIAERTSSQRFSFAIIVAAHNEIQVIEEKLRSILALDYPDSLFEIIVVSDASDDGTNEKVGELVAQVGGQKLSLFVNAERAGKTAAINTAMEHARSDICVFTDANVFLDDQALNNFAVLFDDEAVGAVAGHTVSINSTVSSGSFSNSLYWTYEESLKRMESAIGSTMGADGGLFAVRSELFKRLPEYVLDDFCTSMNAIFRGYRLIYSSESVGYEKVAEKVGEEFSRKIRIANRSYDSYRYLKKEILSMSAMNLWKFLSHKLLRWYSCLFMLALFVGNLLLCAVSSTNALYFAGLSVQVLFYLLPAFSSSGLLRALGPFSKLASASHYFCMANLATAIGVWKSLTGRKMAYWSSAVSGR